MSGNAEGIEMSILPRGKKHYHVEKARGFAGRKTHKGEN